MKKGESITGDILVISQYNMVIIARYPSVMEASKALDVPEGSIRNGLSTRKARHECYWVYASQLNDWKPASTIFRKVKGLKTSEKIKRLLA